MPSSFSQALVRLNIDCLFHRLDLPDIPLAGFTNALIFTIPNSMMADVTDVALLRSKAKQEGIMFSSMETLQSIIQAAVGFVVFWRLDQIGMV